MCWSCAGGPTDGRSLPNSPLYTRGVKKNCSFLGQFCSFYLQAIKLVSTLWFNLPRYLLYLLGLFLSTTQGFFADAMFAYIYQFYM